MAATLHHPLQLGLFAGSGPMPERAAKVTPIRPGLPVTRPGLGCVSGSSARPLKILRDPHDARRTVLSGTMAEVCRELERLAGLET